MASDFEGTSLLDKFLSETGRDQVLRWQWSPYIPAPSRSLASVGQRGEKGRAGHPVDRSRK